jgi:hypothetical protein
MARTMTDCVTTQRWAPMTKSPTYQFTVLQHLSIGLLVVEFNGHVVAAGAADDLEPSCGPGGGNDHISYPIRDNRLAHEDRYARTQFSKAVGSPTLASTSRLVVPQFGGWAAGSHGIQITGLAAGRRPEEPEARRPSGHPCLRRRRRLPQPR